LVAYADIESELLGATADGPLTQLPLDALIVEPFEGPSEAVSASSDLERGAFVTLTASLGALRIRGNVVDTRAVPRLPAAGLDFDTSLPLTVRLVAPLQGRVGRDAPLHSAWNARIHLPVTLLDTADFSASGLIADSVETYLADAASLTVEPSGE
jgi:hypothetical protein